MLGHELPRKHPRSAIETPTHTHTEEALKCLLLMCLVLKFSLLKCLQLTMRPQWSAA